MKKLSNINESVWGGMLSRSTGDTVRKEDNVNLLNMEGFEKYLEAHYTYTQKYSKCGFPMVSSNKRYTTVGIPTFAIIDNKFGTSYFHLTLKEENDEYILSLSRSTERFHIYDVLGEEYIMTDSDNSWDYIIKPKEGKVDKHFFLTVLDFIIANIQSPEENVVEKKSVNESVWGGMLDRSVGDTVRKEDDINKLDLDGMWDYIQKNYTTVVHAMPLMSRHDSSSFISYPMFIVGYTLYRIDLQFKNDKISEIQLEANNKICSEFIDILKEKYDVDDCGGFGMIKIHSKTHKLTNQDAIDIINTIIDNSSKPAIKRKENS